MVALFWIFRKAARRPLAHRFRRLQVVSAGFMAFAHGSNDAQKTMGIITLALFSAGADPDGDRSDPRLGHRHLGDRHLAGHRGGRLADHEARWATGSSSSSRSTASRPRRPPPRSSTRAAHFGMPVSTTHVISSAIMGVGLQQGHPRRPLGRGPQHPHRLGPDHPRRRDHRAPLAWIVLNAARHQLTPTPGGDPPMPRLIPRDEASRRSSSRTARTCSRPPGRSTRCSPSSTASTSASPSIQALEHTGDEIDAEIAVRLERSFITPFDREDIHELSARLDDVVDGIQEAAETVVIYGIDEADRRGPPDGRHHRRPGRAAPRGAQEARPPRDGRGAPQGRSTTSRTRPTACRARRSAGSSATAAIPSTSSSCRDLYNVLEETDRRGRGRGRGHRADLGEGALRSHPSARQAAACRSALGGVRPGGGRRSRRRAPSGSASATAGPARSRRAASGRGRRPCASRPRSRSPTPARAAARG